MSFHTESAPPLNLQWLSLHPAPGLRIPLKDHVANNEAMVLGFLAKKNLNFTDAPDLIHFYENPWLKTMKPWQN